MYTVNKIVKGKVQGITKYGIFVKLDDAYNGLIHISEISDGFVKNIEDYVKINDVINVKILEVDEEKKQIKLSIKNIDYKNNDKRNNLKMIEVPTILRKDLRNRKPHLRTIRDGFRHLNLICKLALEKRKYIVKKEEEKS